MSVEIHLYDDWIKDLRNKLKKIYPDTNIDDFNKDKIPILYFNYSKRTIKKEKREIFRSDNFSCPQKYADALKKIEDKICNGDDLNPYISRKIKEVDYNDDMLNDWGIYHLHLGNSLQNNGLIEGTKQILYCYIDNKAIYFIGIYDHGEWSNKYLLETIHKNWPNLIKIQDVKDVNQKLNKEEIETLRKDHINPVVKLDDGSIVITPGGGFATNGVSIEVMRTVMNKREYILKMESWIQNNEKNVKQQIQKRTTPSKNLKFVYREIEDLIYAYEIYSKTFFWYSPEKEACIC